MSMQSVCEEIGISRTYLSRLFRRYGDSTFNAYLTSRRMEAAMQLLQERPNILLRDVAACVGYEDSSYFSKVFHQYSGLTPIPFFHAQAMIRLWPGGSLYGYPPKEAIRLVHGQRPLRLL